MVTTIQMIYDLFPLNNCVVKVSKSFVKSTPNRAVGVGHLWTNF